MKPELITIIDIDGIDGQDYPDFCDAFVAEADYDGEPMTEEELDQLNDSTDSRIRSLIHDAILQHSI